MKRIGIVSCDKWINKIEEDTILKNYLSSLGYLTEIISWENKEINFQEFDALIIRSCWGYQNKIEEFIEWLYFLKRNNIQVFNRVDIILNNIQKDYQFALLDKYNIPHIKTNFIDKVTKENLEENQVIKPTISGSGENTYLVSKNNFEDILFKLNMIKNSRIKFMVQPFIKEICNGEYSLIYINGKYQYAVLRYPGILSQKNKPVILNDIPNEVLKVGNLINEVKEYENYLYARVDIVIKEMEAFVMEVELAEPDLYIKRLTNKELVLKEIGNRIKEEL